MTARPPIQQGPVNASETPAATAPVSGPSLAMLLSRHVLRDGEVILLILKPSIWFILFISLRFLAGMLIIIIGARLLSARSNCDLRIVVEIGALMMAARIMWAILQWMGRLYILTDMRIMRLDGVFQADLFDCPLRKVARTRLLRSLRERVLNLGTIEIIPREESCAIASWQTISRPLRVHEQIQAAITRARQGSGDAGGGL